jgi:hypothetical protein
MIKENLMLINDHEQYNRVSFNDEAEIEDVVRKFASSLFGTHIVYLPQQKITTLGGTGTVPDAIVIDLKAEQWYLVEAERGCHGTWQHIAPQVSKQLAALSSPAMRNSLLKLTLDQISQNAALRQVFAELGIPDIEVHGKLQAILAKPATIAIPIDEVPVDMNDWLVTLRNSAKVWVLGKYVSASDPKHVLYSLPDEALPTMATVSTQDGSKITVSRSQLYQKLLSSGLMPEGTVLTMDYGPRGKPRRTFRGIVRKNGIEVEGRMYSSPSAAAAFCMEQVSGTTRSANGWVWWKTPNGKTIDQVYQEMPPAEERASDRRVSTAESKDILYSVSDEAAPILASVPTEVGNKVIVGRSQLYQELISSGLMPVGTLLTMNYGPKGKTRWVFKGTVRPNGIEVEGRVFSSPSAAAVFCMKRAGGLGRSANGWVWWKTPDGKTLAEVCQKQPPTVARQRDS